MTARGEVCIPYPIEPAGQDEFSTQSSLNGYINQDNLDPKKIQWSDQNISQPHVESLHHVLGPLFNIEFLHRGLVLEELGRGGVEC